eukprot:866189_1
MRFSLASLVLVVLPTSLAFTPLPSTKLQSVNNINTVRTQTRGLAVSSPVEEEQTQDLDVNASAGPTVDFPPPLSKIDRLKRAATFWSSALPIVLSYYSKSAELSFNEALTGETLTEEQE